MKLILPEFEAAERHLDLTRYIQELAQAKGGAAAVVVSRADAGVGPLRYRVRITKHGDHPQVEASHSDPFVAAREAFGRLFALPDGRPGPAAAPRPPASTPDRVERAGNESFPASDPPSYNPQKL